VGTFFVSIFLFLMQFLWKYIGDLIGKGLEWYIIFEFILYSIPYLIPRALPLAVLLSCIMTYGNLGEKYELVALKAAGVSLLRTMQPMLILMTIIAGVAFYSSNILIPKANLSWGALFYDVTHKKPAMNIQDGIFFKDLQGYAIRVGKKHSDNQTLDDVLIYAKTENSNVTNIILAKKGKMELTDNDRFLRLTLFEGKRYEEMTNSPGYDKTYPHNTMSFQEYNMAIDLSELELKRSNPELFKDNYEMLNLKELQQRIDSLAIVIQEKKQFLHAYLEAYFHFRHDSLGVSDYKIHDSTWTGFSYEQVVFRAYEKINQAPDTLSVEETVSSMTAEINYPKDAVKINQPNQSLKITNEPWIDTLNKLEMKPLIESATQSTRNLRRIVESTKKEVRQITERRRRYAIQWHKKFTLAFSCILLFFVGAPLGAIIRKGGFGAPMIAAILMFIVFFIMQTVGEKLAREGVLLVWSGAWFSFFLFVPIGLFLTYKASRDSVLFDADSYRRLYRRIVSLVKKD
jgi:lipopolysaccharide export system permease protein